MPDELRCRYCKTPMDRAIVRNPYNHHSAPGDVCRACLKDEAVEYAGVDPEDMVKGHRRRYAR